MAEFKYQSRMPVEAGELFSWHGRPGAFERLLPPWEDTRLVERTGGIRDGARLVMELRKGPFRRRWTAVHRGYEEGRRFQDVQEEGPFSAWVHTHSCLPEGDGASILEDHVEYRLPLGALGRLAAGSYVHSLLERAFRFRHARLASDLERHRDLGAAGPLRVAVTGASGLVGRSLADFLRSGGHEVLPLVRRPPRPGTGEVFWSPSADGIDAGALEGLDAVVHLAGENVGRGRWTAEKKRAIRESRVEGTRRLAEALARLERPPRAFVCASATGFYGDRGEEELTEESAPGEGFLAEVCREWEAACEPAARPGVRVVNLRIGVVLSSRGGALPRMLTPFRLGLGGPAGSGRQYMSWIHLDDLTGAICHLIADEEINGPVNGTAPQPAANADFGRTLGRVLRRPAFLPLPAAAVRLLLGEKGQALLLEGARARPAKLEEAGFRFHHPDLEEALRFELGR